VTRADAVEYYVALADGVQRIGEVAADLLRFAHPGGPPQLVDVAPGTIGTVPIVESLPVNAFPETGGAAADPVVCAAWEWSDASVKTVVSTGESFPGESGVTLSQADGAGPRVDSFVMPPGHSVFVRAAAATGAGADTGPLYLVTDSGVAYGISDIEAAERLGLTGPPTPAPWPVLAQLPRGPELSVAAASVARDAVGAAP